MYLHWYSFLLYWLAIIKIDNLRHNSQESHTKTQKFKGQKKKSIGRRWSCRNQSLACKSPTSNLIRPFFIPLNVKITLGVEVLWILVEDSPLEFWQTAHLLAAQTRQTISWECYGLIIFSHYLSTHKMKMINKL